MKDKRFVLEIFLVFILFLCPRLPGLGRDITNSDAVRWHKRSENFLNALKSGDLKATYQRYHPGVTLMWINSGVKLGIAVYQQILNLSGLTLGHAGYYPAIHGISKGVNVFVLGVLVILQVVFLTQIFDRKTSFVYGVLLSLEPYVVGINRWFHLSSFEVFFSFTSLLSVLMWYKFSKNKFVCISAVLFVLSYLAKVTTLFLFPVFLYIFYKKFRADRQIKPFISFCFVCAFLTFVLFPALAFDPVYVFTNIFNHLTGAVVDNPVSYVISPYIKPIFYFVILLFKSSPLTLLIFVTSWWSLRKTKDFYIKVFYLAFFVYLLFLTLSSQKIDRYSLAFFPYILVFAALWVRNLNPKFLYLLIFGVVIFFGYVVFVYYPVFSAYYSPLFGGTGKAISLNIYDNSGEYFAQAAQYLNTKGRDVCVAIPENIDSFSYYFMGKTQIEVNGRVDYVVKSLDVDRSFIMSPGASFVLDKAFGPDSVPVVYVFARK